MSQRIEGSSGDAFNWGISTKKSKSIAQKTIDELQYYRLEDNVVPKVSQGFKAVSTERADAVAQRKFSAEKEKSVPQSPVENLTPQTRISDFFNKEQMEFIERHCIGDEGSQDEADIERAVIENNVILLQNVKENPSWYVLTFYDVKLKKVVNHTIDLTDKTNREFVTTDHTGKTKFIDFPNGIRIMGPKAFKAFTREFQDKLTERFVETYISKILNDKDKAEHYVKHNDNPVLWKNDKDSFFMTYKKKYTLFGFVLFRKVITTPVKEFHLNKDNGDIKEITSKNGEILPTPQYALTIANNVHAFNIFDKKPWWKFW